MTTVDIIFPLLTRRTWSGTLSCDFSHRNLVSKLTRVI